MGACGDDMMAPNRAGGIELTAGGGVSRRNSTGFVVKALGRCAGGL